MLAVRCESVVLNGGCLRKPRRHFWRWQRRRVVIVAAAEEQQSAAAAARRQGAIARGAYRKAEACFLCARLPQPEAQPVLKFDTRCQGLLHLTTLACQIYPTVPRLLVLARVWRELPIYPHRASFDLSALRSELCEPRRAPLRWRLLCLNRLLMSAPSFACEELVKAAQLARGLTRSAPTSASTFFAFTPALWSRDEFACADDEELVTFCQVTARLFDASRRPSDDSLAPFMQCSEALSESLSIENNSVVWPPVPPFLTEALGHRISDLRELRRILFLLKAMSPRSVSLRLLVDDVLALL